MRRATCDQPNGLTLTIQHHGFCPDNTSCHGLWECHRCAYRESCPTAARLECHLLIELIESILGQLLIRIEHSSSDSYVILFFVHPEDTNKFIRIFGRDLLLDTYRVEYLGRFQLYDTDSFSELVRYLRKELLTLPAATGRP